MHVKPNNESTVSGTPKRVKNPQLPPEMRPRTGRAPLSQHALTTAGPKISTASQWAADFYRTEKRLQLEDEHAEAIANMTGGKSAPQLAVRTVYATSVPNADQIRSTGLNGNANVSPSSGNPPPKNTARPTGIPVDVKPVTGKRKGDHDHGGSNKRQNVASLNPLTDKSPSLIPTTSTEWRTI